MYMKLKYAGASKGWSLELNIVPSGKWVGRRTKRGQTSVFQCVISTAVEGTGVWPLFFCKKLKFGVS